MASVYRPAGRRKYRIEFKDEKGLIRKVVAFRDRRASESLGHKLETDAERLRAGMPLLYPQATALYFSLRRDLTRALEDVCDSYLNDLARRGSGPESCRYRDCKCLLRRLQRDCGWNTLADIRADDFTEFLGRLAGAGRAPRTQNHYLAHLRAFLNFCVRQGWLPKSPIDGFKPVKVGQAGRRRIRRAFTAHELQLLCDASHPRRARAYRVAAFSGLRRSELRKLQKQDCTPAGDRPRWHARAGVTKNGQDIRLPMAPECADALREWWQSLPRPDSRLLIVPDRTTFVKDLKRAGIARRDERGRYADFHSLRYTFCWLCAQKYPIQVVQKLMRHGSINLTADLYLDLGLEREGEGEWVLLPLLPGPKPGESGVAR